MERIVFLLLLIFAIAIPLPAFAQEEAAGGKLIRDPKLEDEIRQALSIRNRSVTKDDLLKLRKLALPNERIHSLEGLEFAAGLEEIDLSGNRIRDVAPLRSLQRLRILDLSDNRISDIRPLSGLSSLIHLNMSLNSVKDLAPLSGLANLVYLQANYNRIRDLSPIGEMKKLESLFLFGNRISDLKPLGKRMKAKQNRLLRLDVRGNPLAQTMQLWIDSAKKEKPIDLFFDPPRAPAIDFDIPILIDGELQPFSGQAVILQNRAFVPMRALFEKLGFDIKWEKGGILASKADTVIRLEVGSPKAYVNGSEKELEAAPVQQNGTVLVPLRFVAENAGSHLVWERTAQAVILTTDPTATRFRHGFELVRDSGEDDAAPFKFVSASGDQLLPDRYISAEPFRDGLAVVRRRDGNWALVNFKGEYVLYSPYKLTGLSEGLVLFRGKDGWGYLDTSGEVAIEADYEQANPFREGKADVIFDGTSMTLTR
ncbi:hypothetical protein GE107_09695 [Cohnella sp. CFH 77786]|uniref:leucine-rich repeat domain-containing protein n=1 Tax=Cohnella sp. CFH 77786 TaxID=2662265 RepID=UPI001C6082EC|nr:leucine-rich repeat domain-containing protein [Cohnella sp. CFH 77786]MBW5446331.1 hypothetical protein [Cohnella sp. CFH 77786]